MNKEEKNLNLLYLVSNRWSKPYFDLALKVFLKKRNIIVNRLKIICLSKDAISSLKENPDLIKEDIFQSINGSINLIFSRSLISKIKSKINQLNNFEWTIVTDNEMRNSEILFFAFLVSISDNIKSP